MSVYPIDSHHYTEFSDCTQLEDGKASKQASVGSLACDFPQVSPPDLPSAARMRFDKVRLFGSGNPGKQMTLP